MSSSKSNYHRGIGTNEPTLELPRMERIPVHVCTSASEFSVPSRCRAFSFVGKVACMDRSSIEWAERMFGSTHASCNELDSERPWSMPKGRQITWALHPGIKRHYPYERNLLGRPNLLKSLPRDSGSGSRGPTLQPGSSDALVVLLQTSDNTSRWHHRHGYPALCETRS